MTASCDEPVSVPPPLEPSSKAGTPEDGIDESEYPSGLRLAAILMALVFSIFLASLDLTIISTAIPEITDKFQSLNDVGWYASALFLPVAATQSMWGKAFKYFPIKTVFIFSIFVFEVGSLLCGIAPDSDTFIVGRAITGIGVAGTFSGCYIIIAFSSPPRARPALTGVLGSTYAVASIVGPLIGGALTDGPGWRWCFYINLPFGGVAAVAIFVTFHPPKAARPTPATLKEKLLQMDIQGAILICAAVVCYLLALQQGGVVIPWKSSRCIGLLVGSGLISLTFGLNEWWMAERALIHPKFLRDRTIVSGCWFCFFIAGNFYILLFYLPIYFQAVKGASAMNSGIRLLPLILGMTLFQVLVGIIITAWGVFNPFMIGGAALASVGSGLLMKLAVDSPASMWIGYQTIAGIGLGLCFTIPIIVTQRITKASEVSTATALVLFSQSLGGSLIVSAAQAVFQNVLVKHLAISNPTLNPLSIATADATTLRHEFASTEISGILDSYVHGLRSAFALSIPMAGIAMLLAFVPKWIHLSKFDSGEGSNHQSKL
ncbi:DNA repair protein RAD50 [Lophiotrema nucula]|uniref:DNA repair protein RAD50 n=1 Tax=Lophiotrema nucula TaxID=690887 RepID=A0A6A5Z323_9PLEO|nr:DNA repair protein RAD50 [Lophiotrema nucula]